ncbi:hypothetical protein KC717_05785 [Candidatus Dojkabacteria bacterium]|uniref:Uncharacterized protein n=1 Tax=Candidatus Dojkabacteria bacterium TaxID=2099670 RepID=A0A955L957_9BACT|nr:hypothetical protein [Candidatus Dojkabacteria bacterium]
MHYLNEVNINISGHVSSGTTITALILAYMLKKRFVYAGGTYKFIAKKLGYDPKSGGLLEYEKKYGEKWDVLWEHYIAWKLEHERNLLVNSKIAGFFTESKPWLFEAFITASPEVRSKRAGTDKRTENVVKRDHELQTRWKKLFNIDLLDLDEIRATHDYLCENDTLSIAQTAHEIFNVLRKALSLKEQFLFSDFEKVEKIALAKGKDFFYEKLEEKNQLIDYPEVFKDWVTHFEDELADTADEWQGVVKKYAA